MRLIAKKKVDVNISNDFNNTPLTVCIISGNTDVLKELCKRPDLKVTDEAKNAAKEAGINLNDYIKPDNSVFDEATATSMADLLSELESAASVMA